MAGGHAAARRTHPNQTRLDDGNVFCASAPMSVTEATSDGRTQEGKEGAFFGEGSSGGSAGSSIRGWGGAGDTLILEFTICGNYLSRSDGLTAKMRTIPATDRSYPCTTCSKAFSPSSHLARPFKNGSHSQSGEVVGFSTGPAHAPQRGTRAIS